MPRIPTYQPNQIGPVAPVEARVRAANNNGGVVGALGEGMASLGGAVMDFAKVQDQIDAQNDDTQARKIAMQTDATFSTIENKYKAMQGGNAREAQAGTLAELSKLRDETLKQASNPRMRRLLEDQLGTLYTSTVNSVSSHALREQQAERSATLVGQSKFFVDKAVRTEDPIARAAATEQALKITNEALDFTGIRDPDARAQKVLETRSTIHRGVLDGYLAKDDVDLTQAYFAAHGDEMTVDDREAIQRDLKEPLQRRQAYDDASRALFGGAGPATAPAPSGEVGPAFDKLVADKRGGMSAPAATPAKSAPIGKVDASIGPQMQMIRNVLGKNSYIADPKKHKKFTADGNVSDHWGDKARALDFAPPEGMRKYSWAQMKGIMESELAKRGLRIRTGGRSGNTLQFFGPGHGPHGDDGSHDDHFHVAWEPIPGGSASVASSGSGAMASETPREWDKDAAYNRVDTLAKAEGWSFERTERAKRNVDQRIAVDEGLKARKERTADEAASMIMLEKLDGFTSMNMIPADIRANMSVGALASAQSAIKSNTAPREVKADGASAIMLKIMKNNQPEVFIDVNLAEYVGTMTRDEISDLIIEQQKMKHDNGDIVKRREEISTTINSLARFGNIKLNDADKAAVARQMETLEIGLINSGKPVDRSKIFTDTLRLLREAKNR